MKKTNSNDKLKKEFIYFTITLIVTTSANSAPLSDVFRLLLSHGLTIVT